MRIIAMVKVIESGCVLPTSTCLIQVHSAQMAGERSSHQSINSVNYTSYGIPYSRVRGRIIAYQFGTPEGFLGYIILIKFTKHLMMHTLMEFQLHLVIQGITFGHLLQQY